MRKSLLLVEHITISGVVLFVLLGFVLLAFSLVQDVLTNPYLYFDTEISLAEIQFAMVYVSLVVVCVLLSYILYLLLTLQTRAKIMVLNATKSLDISLEQFKKLYEGAPVPYIILNELGEIRESNKAALRFFGVVEEEIKAKNLFSFQPKEDLEKADKLLQYYKSDIPINQEEIRMITKGGDIRWALLSVFEIKSLKSSKRTGLATIFDITEQKQLDRAKSEFVSLASHQLRAPVTTIKWYTEMLLSPSTGELSLKQRDYMSRIDKVNEEMISLIETLLNASRIEIGSIKIEAKQTNVIELTESVLTEFVSQITEKKIVINRQYDDNLKNIESDPKLLRIVIQNLISNAIKYTPNEGLVTVTFKDSVLEKSITISDTGIGIPKAEQDKIFTKLFRSDNARNIDSGGIGLGLYMVKSIIEAMGGGVYFSSEENKGSSFVIKL